MELIESTARFVHHELGARRPRERFWATTEQADELEQMGLAVRAEKKPTPLAYDTKAGRSPSSPADLLQAETMSSTVELAAGPSGPSTPASDSAATVSTPATTAGGLSTTPRRGRPRTTAGPTASEPPKNLG